MHRLTLSCSVLTWANPRAASTWALSGDSIPVGHMDHELQSHHQPALPGMEMSSH